MDDGKSTLIGRLLLDSQQVFQDHLSSLEKDSKRHGTVASGLDPALLLDGLEAEREQGITIDLAYRYFSTPRRKFILADAPGHLQYTRNMVTGASTADLAVLLVDARQGVLEQTRRHAFLCSLMGIQHMVVAVNKMDLVDFCSEAFGAVREVFTDFAARLDLRDLHFLPLSALTGDNVVRPSERMPWFVGPTLLHLLETVHVASDRNLVDLRLPIQSVLRHGSDFRGYQGTLASGVLRPGDEVLVLPSRKRTRVERIVTFDGDLEQAVPPQAVTVTLADEVDIARGDLLVRPENLPHSSQDLEVMLAWLVETPLRCGVRYLVHHGHRSIPATISRVRYRTNVETLRREPAETLTLNEIGRCQLHTHRPLHFDAYRANRATGCLILVDPASHETVAAGILVDRRVDPGATEETRIQAQGGKLVWLRGPASSARKCGMTLERRLLEADRKACMLDALPEEGPLHPVRRQAVEVLLQEGFLVILVGGEPTAAELEDAAWGGVSVVAEMVTAEEGDDEKVAERVWEGLGEGRE